MKTFNEFAKEIGLNRQQLNNIINFSDKFYNSYYMEKKKKGETRPIDCPNAQLKTIQRWLLRNFFENIKVNFRANGFIKKRGIKRNAQFHRDMKFILCMDIKNFFSSIKIKDIYRILREEINDTELAYKISKICTFKGYLPQGAPTSPVISNIVFKAVDEEITEICKKRKVIYSRYADDLTFSTNNKQYLIDLIKPITEIVKKHGFKINSEKTRLYSGKRRMSVTGVILNSGRLTVGRDLKRNIRAGLYNVIVKNDKKINKKVLMGYISFIKDIEPDYFESIKKYKNKLLLEVGNK